MSFGKTQFPAQRSTYLSSVVIAAVGFGLSFRLLYGFLFGDRPGTLSDSRADALYCLPFSHLESIVLGVMIGRGALSGIGRLLPGFAALALGALNLWLSGGEMKGEETNPSAWS